MRLLTEDPQEIWDITVNYFKNARSQCTTANGIGCMYENDKGQRCVVGNVLVAETAEDEHTLREFIGGWMSLFEDRKMPNYFGTKLGGMFDTLQTIHDSSGYWTDGGHGPLNEQGFNRLNVAAHAWGFEHVPVS